MAILENIKEKLLNPPENRPYYFILYEHSHIKQLEQNIKEFCKTNTLQNTFIDIENEIILEIKAEPSPRVWSEFEKEFEKNPHSESLKNAFIQRGSRIIEEKWSKANDDKINAIFITGFNTFFVNFGSPEPLLDRIKAYHSSDIATRVFVIIPGEFRGQDIFFYNVKIDAPHPYIKVIR